MKSYLLTLIGILIVNACSLYESIEEDDSGELTVYKTGSDEKGEYRLKASYDSYEYATGTDQQYLTFDDRYTNYEETRKHKLTDFPYSNEATIEYTRSLNYLGMDRPAANQNEWSEKWTCPEYRGVVSFVKDSVERNIQYSVFELEGLCVNDTNSNSFYNESMIDVYTLKTTIETELYSEIRTIKFSDPGEDRIWFSEDDSNGEHGYYLMPDTESEYLSLINASSYQENSVNYVVEEQNTPWYSFSGHASAAGTASVSVPEDSYFREVSYNNGAYVVIHYSSVGSDGEQFTDDDAVVSRLDVSAPTETEMGIYEQSIVYEMFSSIGNKKTVAIIRKNAAGDILRKAMFVSSGEDGVWLTKDDVVSNYTVLIDTTDETGGEIKDYRMYGGAGDDETWFNEDDVAILSTKIAEQDMGNYVLRTITETILDETLYKENFGDHGHMIVEPVTIKREIVVK